MYHTLGGLPGSSGYDDLAILYFYCTTIYINAAVQFFTARNTVLKNLHTTFIFIHKSAIKVDQNIKQ